MDLDSVSLLIPKVRDGDEAAREKLLGELCAFLESIASQNIHGSLKQKVGASDVVQLSLLRIVEGFETFHGKTTAELRPWLRKIVINEIYRANQAYHTGKRDVAREQSLEHSGGSAPDGIDGQLTPSSEAIAAERIALFKSLLKTLTPEHAQVIQLRSIEELSFREIGQQMDRSEDAVSKLWYRAMTKLEQKLVESSEFDSLGL